MTGRQARETPFVQMHAAGNRFVLVDALDLPPEDVPAPKPPWAAGGWPALARETAHPNFAIGHDGLLVVLRGRKTPFRQRMFNPDGTEDMCGNGLHCTAKYLFDTDRIGREAFEIETISGARTVQVIESKPPMATVRSALAPPQLQPVSLSVAGDEVPPHVAEALTRATYAQMGTPHLVLFADWESLGERWTDVSRSLEEHPDLPDRVTVTWVRRDAPDRLTLRFWERSVGETLSCGTGACAAAAVAHEHGLSAMPITVVTAGGEMTVRWDGQGEIELTGPAVTICRGTWPPV